MKVTKRRLLSLLLAVATVLSLFTGGTVGVFAAQTSDYYVAVGDSITAGIYGADGRVKDHYTFMLANQKGYKFDEDSLVADNYTSGYVKELLETDSEVRAAVSKAGLVTVMLGVEDMMNVVYQAMADEYNKYEDPISAGDVPGIINGTVEGNRKQLMFGAMPLINKEQDTYLAKSAAFQDAVKAFSGNLSAIIAEIQKLAPDATLLVATQYNPLAEYNGKKIKIPLTSTFSMDYDLTSLYQCMEDGVAVLNGEIEKKESAGVEIVDIKAAFEKKYSESNDLYEACVGETLSTLSWDINPTEAGYRVMAAAFAEKTPDAPKYYNVSFDANGGSGEMASLVTGENYTLPKTGFTAPRGYDFAGWATSAGGEAISGNSITLTEDVTLYAVWAPQKLTGTVKISGAMQVGSALTVTVSGTNNTGEFTYQWYRDNAPISGATGTAYKLTNEDVGCVFYCEVASSVQTGKLKSDVSGKVQAQVFAEGEVEIDSYTGIYDGKSHSFSVKVPNNTTVEFSVDGKKVEKQPEFTIAGIYTVSYSVAKSGFTAVTGTVQVVIERKDVTVKADGCAILYGEEEPALTYQVEGLIGEDKLKGALTRDPGTDVGSYDIKQGTLTNETNPNYNIIFTGNKFVIGKNKPAYTVPAGLTAIYGQKLLEIKLPAGFSWENPQAYVGDVGTNTFPVIYTPDDAVNYEEAVMFVDLKVIDAPNSIQVDYDSSLGSVTGAGAYEDGAEVKLTATATAAGKFEYWVDATVDVTGSLTAEELKTKIISREATYSFTADGDVHLRAVFSPATVEIVPMLITGTTGKALTEAKRLNTKLDFGSIKPGDKVIELPGDLIKKEFTEGEKQYKLAGIIVAGHNIQESGNGYQVTLQEKLTVGVMPLYGSAEYQKWLEPITGGVYAAYMENTAVTGEANSKNPSTGDNSDMVMWLVILLFCVGGVALLSLTGKKRKK